MKGPIESSGKARYVQGMFARIVPRYDLLNLLISGGRDGGWRRRLAQAAGTQGEGPVLDVATGTGEQALALLRRGADEVVGLDFCSTMLDRARQKVNGAPVTLVQGDALRLPFADGVFAAATTSFAMRNVEDIEQAFREMRRVVRPGGRVACLEIALPAGGAVGPLFRFYFYRVVPRLGALVSGQPDAYSYLPHSLDNFPSPGGLSQAMERAGLGSVGYERLGLGAVTLHVGVRAQ